ncbi:MATE family efflux transporter [bacterium]|nr:MATE family efflux transporter [bacterium]
MKKGLWSSYFSGIQDNEHGESYGKIFKYFLPEFVTALVLYSLLYLLDAYFIADLKSTSMYATLGVTNTLLHFLVKIAEGLSVGAIVLTGRHNGAQRYEEAGRSFVDAFWATFLSGAVIASFLYFCADWIYIFYGVPKDMVSMGTSFLRIRAIGIFFMFMYFAFIGFLRGVKNTRTPMKIFLVGAVVFIFFDYALIFGKFGFPEMQLSGSAMASVLQYAFMLVISIVYIVTDKRYRKYGIQLFSVFSSGSQLKRLIQLSWRIMVDKATIAGSYIWLGAMIAPMGKYGLATFSVVKDLERLALLPAVAFAQVITFLVSNDYDKKNWIGIKTNVKKIVFLASMIVFAILIVLSLWPHYFVSFFDKKGDFSWLAARVLPLLSVLVFFDVLQLILAGAMRGASNVKTVMKTRLVVCIGYFVPVSYIFSVAPIQNPVLKFTLIYGSFYVGNALMSLAYINRFRGQEWKKQAN